MSFLCTGCQLLRSLLLLPCKTPISVTIFYQLYQSSCYMHKHTDWFHFKLRTPYPKRAFSLEILPHFLRNVLHNIQDKEVPFLPKPPCPVLHFHGRPRSVFHSCSRSTRKYTAPSPHGPRGDAVIRHPGRHWSLSALPFSPALRGVRSARQQPAWGPRTDEGVLWGATLRVAAVAGVCCHLLGLGPLCLPGLRDLGWATRQVQLGNLRTHPGRSGSEAEGASLAHRQLGARLPGGSTPSALLRAEVEAPRLGWRTGSSSLEQLRAGLCGSGGLQAGRRLGLQGA